jgi:hypothetical protein
MRRPSNWHPHAGGSPARWPGDRVISTVDPDARHTPKSPESRRDGYRAHVAAEPQTEIITDEELTKAAGAEHSDPAVAERFLAAEATHAAKNDASTRQWYGDSA